MLHPPLTAKLYMTLALVFLGFFSSAFATPILINDNQLNPIELGPHYQLYIDETQTLSIDDILSSAANITFSPLSNGHFNLGFQTDTHWFKVSVQNTESHELKQLLKFDFPLLDKISVYAVDAISKRILSHFESGDTYPFEGRPYQHPNFIFPLTLPAQSDMDLYFQIKSEGTMTAGASLWNPESFSEQHRLDYFYLALYLGLLIGLLCYNFLLYLSLRDKSYLYYVLFSGSLLLALGSYSGLWFELLWPNSPLWHNISVPLSFSLMGIFVVLFSRSFLQTRTRVPKLDKALHFIMIAFVALIIAISVVSLSTIAQVLSIVALILAITISIIAINLSLKGYRTALIYLVAWLIFIIGALVLSARNFGLIPNTVLSQYAIFIGSALEMILISFALAQRINQIKDHYQRLVSDNSQLKDQESSLKQLAHYDALTGLANRTLIMEKLELLLALSKRNDKKLAVLFLDLDGFKPVNDRYGHDAGDEVLITMADRLRSLLRNSDYIGRIGGDEFIVLVEHGDQEFNPQQVADKIRTAIAEPFSILGEKVQLGTSIGISVYPDNAQDIPSLVSFADTAMYINKAYRHH